MKSLFPRIFVWFWLAMTLIGAAFAVIYATTFPVERIERRNKVMRAAILHGADAALERAARGEDAASTLSEFHRATGLKVYVFQGERVLGPGEPSRDMRALAERAGREGKEVEQRVDGGVLLAMPAEGGAVIVARLRSGSLLARAVGTETLHWRLLVIFLVAGVVSFSLARYLTRPLRSLRRATQRVAQGDLAVRVTPELARADAEIAALGRDFDRMAERVQELLVAQQRLLSDVSHELNSPLARLRVALELARQKAGPEAVPALDRIEREAERLSALIGEILTVTRLEHGEAPPLTSVDLGALVEEIVRDADFEAQGANKRVELERTAAVVLLGDEELLRRAIENVVRNAVRFTPEGTAVTLDVEERGGSVSVRVRDRGPGVPEDALRDIFVPLYRVERDRDRKTGGAGLGLAIADRAVKLHGG
ncbi:MAG TPA: ATP-binding protein, partial [Sandaracinaceae bacterium]